MFTHYRQRAPQTVLARLRQLLTWHSDMAALLPRWRHPLVGYAMSVLLVGLSLLIGFVETQLLFPFLFPSVLFLFVVAVVAFIWGAAPALFSVLLSLFVLDYLYVFPSGVLGGYGWSGLFQLITFAAAGVFIAIGAHQREVARMRALLAERAALLHANELEATFEAMNDGVVVYDAQGQVVHTNAATAQLLGLNMVKFNEQERIKQELLQQALHNDERGQLLPEKQRPLARMLKGARFPADSRTDVLMHTSDGRTIVLNRSGAAIKSGNGEIERIVMVYRDVTARRQLEQRSSEALRAFLAIAEVLIQLPDHMAVGESDGVMAQREQSEQIGRRIVQLTRNVVKSIHVMMLEIDEDSDGVRALAATGFTEQQEQQWQQWLMVSSMLENLVGSEEMLTRLRQDEVITLNGLTLPLYTHVLPYYVETVLVAPVWADQRLIGLLCVDDGNREHRYSKHEITLLQTIARLASLVFARAQLLRDREQAQANERALRDANQQMEEFISVVCHELKTPLTVMRGSLQLAERKVKRLVATDALLPGEMVRFAPVQALLERAKVQVNVQDRMVDDLLDSSRIQNGRLEMRKEPCNLVSIVQEAVEDQRQASARTIVLQLPDVREVPVYGDADRLVQVVTNYLTNALKYSPEDRPVEVCLVVDEQVARVSVRDEGSGLAIEEQERIWERFYRAQGVEVQSGSGVGLGIGLHVCRSVIEQHEGLVGVYSAPGEGATFWFTLPCLRKDVSQQRQVGGSEF
jgi:PAS domain S-box-containing protein